MNAALEELVQSAGYTVQRFGDTSAHSTDLVFQADSLVKSAGKRAVLIVCHLELTTPALYQLPDQLLFKRCAVASPVLPSTAASFSTGPMPSVPLLSPCTWKHVVQTRSSSADWA